MQRKSIQILLTFVLFAIVIYLYTISPRAFGGSQALFFVIGMLAYLTHKYRNVSLELTFLQQELFLLMIFNYLAYHEVSKGFSNDILVLATITLFLVSMFVSIVVRLPFGARITANMPQEDMNKEIRMRVTGMIDSGIVGLMLTYTGTTIALFEATYKETQKVPPISFTATILIWFILILAVSYVRGRKVPDRFLSCLVEQRYQLEPARLKRHFLLLILSTFAVGSFIEVVRGMWTMWILSWVAMVFIMMVAWRSWQYIFTTHECDKCHTLRAEELPSIFGDYTLLKFIVINFVVILFYGLGFIAWLYFLWSG